MGKRNGPSKQPSHRGVIVYVNENTERPYGFISPAGSDGSRVSNVFFSTQSLQGQDAEIGDEVDFVFFKRQNLDRPNKAAWRVWIRKPSDDRDQITTLRGEFEV